MIAEISNFIEELEKNNKTYFTEGLTPSEGMHVLINLEVKKKNKPGWYKSFLYKKGDYYALNKKQVLEKVDVDYNFAEREYYSTVIDMNKALDLPDKKIQSSSTFVLWFKKQSLELIPDRLESYFVNAVKYIDKKNINKASQIKDFCKNELSDQIRNDILIKELKDVEYIKIYFDISMEVIKQGHEKYLAEKLFLKDDFNLEDAKKQVFGVSSFLNGANSKKKFMIHQTTPFQINNRISKNQALYLYKFENLLKSKKKKLPNPLPIFVDKDELNQEMVRLFSKEGVESYQQIIKRLFDQHSQDLSNYYLINWANRKGIVINDFDFVSLLRFKLSDFHIDNIMGIPNRGVNNIDNIFEFESEVIQRVFNNSLVVRTKEGKIILKYFDEIDPGYCTRVIYNNILKYRKSIYDYVYKSKEETISGLMFYEMLMSTIIDDILHDTSVSGKNSFGMEFQIKEKLNILFSLNNKFDQQNKNFGGNYMPSKIPAYMDNMRQLLNNSDYHLQDDDNEFAFAAGQLIYYILTKSQTSNKSHALLEPFISKNDPYQFKLIITRGIEQYKHAFDFGSRRFEKLAGEVLGYECKKGIKELLPVLLAGYFSQSLIFEKSSN